MPEAVDTEQSMHAGTSVQSGGGSAAAVRLVIWVAWAVLVLSVYYLQLWNAPWSDPPAFDYVSSLEALKLSTVLALVTGLVALAAYPLGALLESPLGWPRLSSRWATFRRVASGALLILVVLGPLHAPVGTALQGLAGSSLPFAGEAASRNLSGIFGMLVVFAAALPAGQVVCAWLGWRSTDWRDELLYCASVGFGVIAAGCGILALVGLFRPRAIQLLLVAMLIVGVPRLWTLLRRAGWWAVGEGPGDARWFRSGLQVLSAAALFLAFLTALAPEKEYDALWYHLGLPKIWLEAGRPVDLVHDYVSLYPLQWELVFTSGLVIGGPVAAKLLHFICLPLGALLVWQLTTRLAPQARPWLAVALFLTVPTVLWEATTAYVDLVLALYIGLGVLALLRYAENEHRGWFGLAVVTFGIAMAIKHLALVAVAILGPGFALWLWRRAGWTPWRALVPAALLVAVALLIPLPWYARAWLASGNPFFPELFGLFGASPPDRWDHLAERGLAGFKARFGMGRAPMDLLALPWNMTMHASRFGGSLGPLFLVLLPALAIFRGRTARLAWLAWFAVFFAAVWASPISSFQLRFLVVLTPILAVLAAEAARRLTAVSPAGLSKTLAGVLLVLLALNLPPFTRFHERERVGWDGWFTHVIHYVPLDVVLGRDSEDEYLARYLPTYGAWQFLNRSAPRDARIMTFRGGDHYYTDRRRISSVSPMARAAVWAPEDQQTALGELRALGVTHLLVDRQSLESGSSGVVLLEERVRRAALELVYEDGGALVFRLREAGGESPAGQG
jgi:hypothetical protein